MSKIGLFVGSTTGKTEEAAEIIQKEFGGDGVLTIHNMTDAQPDDFNGYQNLIVASPTWNIGELQSDWEGFFDELDNIDFKGKKVAYFGTGDRMTKQPAAKQSQSENPLQRLTEREVEVLRLVVQGSSNREIATQLVITEGTVKSHISNILNRLDARDRTQAA
uniref:LuxR C-terminal-related transcriptional regulator n=1 Tax=Okeania sp. SIO2F4 TaxID=2607790 RepID=UPI0025E0E276